MERCTECLKKPPQPETPAAAWAKSILWLQQVGWNEKSRAVYRVRYCTTCGLQWDNRRKLLKEQGKQR